MNKIVAGVDMGGTNTVVGLVTQYGKCLVEESFRTQESAEFSSFIGKVASKIETLIKNIGGDYTLIGVGIGAPNGSYHTGEIINAANLRWRGSLPLGKDLSDRLEVPVLVTNDANAATLGEMLFGAAEKMQNFVYITLGTGLGSGIVVDGKLVHGSDGFAGELGHTSIKPSGRQCGCGKKGCLETYVSAPGLRRTVFKLLSDSNLPSALRTYPYEKLSAKIISDHARQGDKIALEAFEYTGQMLGLALANVVATLSPEAIFLFGGLSNAGDLIFEPTKRHMEQNLFPIFRNKVKLLPSGLTDKNVAVIGAAALIWKTMETWQKMVGES
jgi:glucokinase